MSEMTDKMPKKNPLSLQIDPAKFEPATDEEKAQQDIMHESTSFLRDGMRKLMKNPLAVGAIITLIIIILMIFIVPGAGELKERGGKGTGGDRQWGKDMPAYHGNGFPWP